MIMQEQKSESLLYIEECIRDIQMKVEIDKNLETIKRTFNRMYNNKVKCEAVLISEPKGAKSRFFGARIFPTKNSMIKMIGRALDGEKTYMIEEYVIEIDSRLLYDKNIKATAGEIVAVLLHEIGHIINTDKIYRDFKHSLYIGMTSFGLKVLSLKQFLNTMNPFIFLLQLIIIKLCSRTFLKMLSEDIESKADQYAVMKGYGEELNSLIVKLINIGEYELLTNNDKINARENKVIVNWSLENIMAIRNRHDSIVTMLGAEKDNTDSPYLKLLLADTIKDINDMISDTKKLVTVLKMQESYIARTKIEIIQDGFLFKWNRTPIKTSQKDIDEIKLEIQKMQDIDDKFYVLELIQARREKVEYALEYKGDNPTDELSKKLPDTKILTDYLKQLNDMQLTVINTKMNPKEYGVFVKYPDGYKG